ncbi:6081_t:CDS:2 [Acaulospora morrowiae]|uniref:6081_t:CDS:1 n=1 Tax=Acaulospora morrowiae TaxID=94023 RepID=A0A9N8VAJ0_9GLOM|nr:6081_t:CDS:2 [Acaulospora morrowiae]
MSIDVDDSGVFSRLQLARALKEDLDNPLAEPPDNSAIFSRQRARKSDAPVGQFYIPRPTTLLTPPILSTIEPQNNEPQHLQEDKRNSTQPPNANVRGSVVVPSHEERRGSLGKPATLLDIRKSMLDTRQSIHNMLPFSPASSQRTSQILQQQKSLPNLSQTKQSQGASRMSTVSNNNSRQSSLSTNSSRPTSSHNPASRPTSTFRLSKSFIPQDSEDSSSSSDSRQKSSPKSLKPKSKKLTLSGPSRSGHKKVVDDNEELPEEEQTVKRSIKKKKSIKKHKHAQKSKLEKVEEENSNDKDDEEDDESDSEGDDTPLALKTTPKIRIAAPNGTVKKNGEVIEAWLDDVSANSSPEPEINTRNRRPSSSYVQTPSSPLGPGRKSSLTPEPASVPGNRRPRSTADNIHPPELHLRSQPRKRANSEYVPKRNSYIPEPQLTQVGRISPSPRQDSGYWARDTLAALSGDSRHLNLMNDPNSNFMPNNSQNRSDRHPQHRDSIGSSSYGSRPHSPQIPSPTSQYSRSKDLLGASPNNRQSYYMVNNNNNVHRRVSSDHLTVATNRASYYQQQPPSPQQKHRVR